MRNIFKNFIYFFIGFSVLIMITGMFETTRNQYIFSIMEDNFLNAGEVPAHTLTEYYNFRDNYVFTNGPFIDFLNYIGMLCLFYIFYGAWRDGWNAKKQSLGSLFISYTLLFILILYFLIIIMNYLSNIFVNQIIISLFNDIYSELYIFKLFVEYFIPLFCLAALFYYLSNQLSNFSLNSS